MALTACEQAAADLAEAKAALHQLALGSRAVRVTHADKTREYTPANRNDLLRHIATLQAQVDACNGVPRSGRALTLYP